MKEHYQLTSVAYSKLMQAKVTKVDLFKSIKLFDPYKTMEPISKLGLLFYIDLKGDFNSGAKFPHRLIANSIYDCLTAKDKVEILSYLDWLENGDEEPDEDEFDEDAEIAAFLRSKGK